jgi:hypothetical protein
MRGTFEGAAWDLIQPTAHGCIGAYEGVVATTGLLSGRRICPVGIWPDRRLSAPPARLTEVSEQDSDGRLVVAVIPAT